MILLKKKGYLLILLSINFLSAQAASVQQFTILYVDMMDKHIQINVELAVSKCHYVSQMKAIGISYYRLYAFQSPNNKWWNKFSYYSRPDTYCICSINIYYNTYIDVLILYKYTINICYMNESFMPGIQWRKHRMLYFLRYAFDGNTGPKIAENF